VKVEERLDGKFPLSSTDTSLSAVELAFLLSIRLPPV
jgi:hypothetical protein